MTIQFELVIWTIINFVLLLCVLHFLLFKPMLKMMDSRNAKIKQGQSVAAKRSKAIAEKEEKAAAYLKERERLLAEKVEQGMEGPLAESQRAKAMAEALYKDKAAASIAALEKEEAEIIQSLHAKVPLLSDAVVQRLLEKGL